MAKGKYAHRADTRLKVLESEALQKSQEKINDLTKQLEQGRPDSFRKASVSVLRPTPPCRPHRGCPLAKSSTYEIRWPRWLTSIKRKENGMPC